MNQFSELPLSTVIHHNLLRNNLLKPTPVQEQAIPAALNGADVLATAQTGTGKTLAFLLPILEKLLHSSEQTPAEPSSQQHSKTAPHKLAKRGIAALVLSPTRELAIQIESVFALLSAGTNLRSAVVVGGMSEHTQLNALKRGVDLVIATPGRLEDFLSRRLINLKSVETVVLDEADRMLDMGFQPAIERILSELPAKRQSLFFSATMDKEIERLISRHSAQPVRIAVGDAAVKAPTEIDLHLYEVEHDRKVGLLRHMLEQHDGSFLVFARTKHGTDRLAKRLSRSGLRAVAMHGDRTQNQRNQALAGFRDGRYRVLVATDVAARGIHVDSVAHVVNYDLPQAPCDFIHRIGRTGRAGQRGTASTFSLKSERGEVRRIERECKIRLLPQRVSPDIVSDRDEHPDQSFAEEGVQGIAPARSPSLHGEQRVFRGPKTASAGHQAFGGKPKSNFGRPSKFKQKFSA